MTMILESANTTTWKIRETGTGDNLLYSQAGTPSLDLRFATEKSLDDYVSASNLITFTRASTGTYVDSSGVIQTATTDTPRFDHDPSTLESLGLLIEEARTNLVLYSEEFANAAWSKAENSGTPPQVTPNLAASPDGSITADRLLCTKSGNTYSFVQQASTYSGNDTGSVYLKSNTGSNQTVYFRVGVTASYITVTTEWQRFSIYSTYSGGGNLTIGARDSSDDVVDILAWGAQVEQGAFPTSYIPTTTAALPRAADLASITGANFSSWYNQSKGTAFSEISAQGISAAAGFSDGTGNERWRVGYNSTSNGAFVVVDGGVVQANTAIGSAPYGQFNKIAAAIAINDGLLACNGSTIADTSMSIPTVNKLEIGSSAGLGATRPNGHIKRLTYWPTRLADATLQTITT